ncbi:unnamed protein product, partial [Didymodactylos carnosus]
FNPKSVVSSVLLYDTEDRSAAQAYDCIHYTDLHNHMQSVKYCIQSHESISLNRTSSDNTALCLNDGTEHSFKELKANGTNAQELTQWASVTIELVDQYAQYLESYPLGQAFYGDIMCYTTLTLCDPGLLCLDWRSICDAVHRPHLPASSDARFNYRLFAMKPAASTRVSIK